MPVTDLGVRKSDLRPAGDRGFEAAYKSSELLRGERGAGILVTEEFLCPKCDGRKEEV